MPEKLPTEAIAEAEAALANARSVRVYHRRRTERRSPQRRYDVNIARERLREAMKPLRSESGRFPYGPQTTVAEKNRQRIKDLSAAIQTERRKLWKMLDPQDRT